MTDTPKKTFEAFCENYRYKGFFISEDDLTYTIFDFVSKTNIRLPKSNTVLKEVRE